MRVDVHNRRQAEALTPRPDVWVISIFTPGDKPARIMYGFERVEHFCFSDIAGDCGETLMWVDELRRKGREVILFNPSMAQAMLRVLYDAQAQGKDLIVHCDAGVSRSQAVARFARYAMGADVYSHTIWTDENANGLVLRHLNRIMWDEGYTGPERPGTYNFEGEDDE